MFSLPFYKVVHIVGLVLVMSALGATAIHALNGGSRQTNRARALVAALHGVGVLLLLVGGFGMLARLGFLHGSAFPGWLWVKLVIWGIIAVLLFVPYRRPSLAKPIYAALPILGGLAAYMALYKPV